MNFYRLSALALVCSMGFAACSSDSKHEAVVAPDDEEEVKAVAIDYSLGRAMNKRLGKGINLGNAWDGESYWSCGKLKAGDSFTYTNLSGETKEIVLSKSEADSYVLPAERYNFGCSDNLDAGWGSAISDDYFPMLKAAGFNSVRIPVRWQHNSDPVSHKVNPDRMAGVLDDVQKAIDAGLAVVISFHWYYEIMFAANNATKYPDLYEAEKVHYSSIWTEVATAFKHFPDTMLVWDILNEPTIISKETMNEVMTLGYNSIRAVDKNKTIMFESYHAAKFADLDALTLPQDGNIIYSGHYYEPFAFSHQGHQAQYPCVGDNAFKNSAAIDLNKYVKQATTLYPDVNGGHVPMNMGEFGISGGGKFATDWACDKDKDWSVPSARMKAEWAKMTIEAAEANDMSWHYWGLAKVGGFEAYDKNNGTWYEGFPAAFGL